MAQRWATLPGDHDAWIGDCWSALCDDERAEAAYRRCMELRPELADGWVGLCHLRLLQRDPGAARALLAENSQRFKSYNDSNHDPELLRAAIEFYDRNYPEAERLYQEILTKDYSFQEGFYGAMSASSALGRLKQLLGYEKEGRAILEKQRVRQIALLSQSQDPALPFELAAIEASLDHANQALLHLQTAIDKGWIDVRTLQIDPRFDSLGVDPRFQSLINALSVRIEQMKRAPGQPIKLVRNSGDIPALPGNTHEY